MKREVLFGILFLILLINFSSGARLPSVGGDSDAWGTVLNTFLNVSLNDTGQLRNDAVLNFTTNLTLGQKITFALGGIVDNIVDGMIGITGGLNVTGDVFSQNYNLTNGYLYSTNGTYYLSTNPFGFYNSTTLPAGTETLWNANYSTFLTHITWANANNGTLMLQSNWNATNTSYYLATNPFGFYNSTTLPAGTEALWNANYSTFLTHVTWANAINGTLATWAQVMNGTVSSGGSGVPVNTISAFNQANCPTGWVLADGTLGTPDLRGIFLRGSGTSGILNMSNGTAFIATYGTYQNDSFQGHQHSLPTTTSTGVTENNPGLYLGEMKYTNTVGSTSQYNTNAPLNPLTDNTNGIPRTGAETNPAYYATIYCVKTAEDTAVSNSIWGESGNNVILQNISKSLVINNTNFVVNTTLGNVGIGTTSPETTMEILSDTNQYGTLRIKGKTNVASQYGQLSLLDSTAIAAGVGGQILFGGKYTGTSYTEWGSIIGAKENATDGQYGGYMAFQTRPNGGVNTERMRILWNGNVGIGTTSPQKQLQIGDAGIAAPINNIIIKSMANTASAHTLVESMGAYSIVIAAADTQIYIYYTDSTGAARVATLAGTLIT